METPRKMCVAWMPGNLRKPYNPDNLEWCAVDSKLDADAISDSTICGHVVILRVGSEYRIPTCPECKRILKDQRIRNKQGKNITSHS
jgi:hypothetical protein